MVFAVVALWEFLEHKHMETVEIGKFYFLLFVSYVRSSSRGLFTYYVSQNGGFVDPPPLSAMVSIWLTPSPPSSAFVSICSTPLLYYIQFFMWTFFT